MSINKVALIGATGNIGAPIHKALLDAGFEVIVVSREGSTSTDSLPSHPSQKIVKADFDNVDSLISALKGAEGVVSNVASHALLSQKKLIDAAVAVGVKRFLPSEFGSDLDNEASRSVPFNMPKVEIQDYLAEQAKAHPEFSYTNVACGPFFDWSMAMGLFGDFKAHDVTLWDGGETKVSTTTLASVGKTVVGVFRNLEATKNRTVRVADTTITQKEIIEIAKEIDGKEWTTKVGSTAEAYQAGLDEFKKPEPNMMVGIMNQLYKLIFSAENGGDMEGKLDNDIVGLSVMTGDQIKSAVKAAMA